MKELQKIKAKNPQQLRRELQESSDSDLNVRRAIIGL